MNIRSTSLRLFLFTILLLAAPAVFGQIFWTGVPGTQWGTNFGVATNWSNGTSNSNPPVSTALCQFNGSTAGNVVAASQDGINHNTGNPIGGSAGASGVSIEITAAQTSPVNIISPVSASTGMGLNGITMDAGAGPLTIGDTSANQLLCTLRPSGSVHTWDNESTSPFTIMPNMQINNGGGSSGHVIDFVGPGNFYVTNNLRFNNGPVFTHTVAMDGTGTWYWAAGGVNDKFNNPLGVIFADSGTLDVTSAGLMPFAAGSGVNTITVRGGVLKLDAASQSDTIARTITGTSGAIQVNNGTWTFSGPNTYSISNILTGGELIVSAAEATNSGPLGEGGTVSFFGGTLGFSVNNVFDYSPRVDTSANQQYSIDTQGQNVTFATGLGSVGGTMTKIGAGTLTLSGPSSYTGLTTISAGKLVFAGMMSGTGNITVADGAALGVTATGTQVIPGTLTLGSSSGCTFEFNNVNSTATPIVAAGTLSSAGNITININNGPLAITHSYPLFSWGVGTPPAVTLGVLNGFIGNLTTNANSIVLNVTATAYSWTGSNNNSWDTTTAGNWNQNGGPVVFADGGPAIFDDTSSVTNVMINSLVAPSLLTFNNNTNPYSLTASGGNNIGGSGSVLQSGSGTVTMSGGANTYTGVTTFGAGTMIVSNLANGGSASDIGAAGNAASNLVFNGGSLRYFGAGASIDHLFTVGTSGGTIDSSGTGALVLDNTGAIGYSGNAARTLTLTGSEPDSNILAAVLADNGGPTALTKTGAGKWVLTANNTYSGLTTIGSGTLQVGTGGATGSIGTGSVVDNSGLDINVTGTLTLGAISGTGVLTNDGTGTLILPNNNSYTGGTAINAGTLQIGNGGATGALDANANVTNNGTLIFNSTGTYSLGGNLTGTGNVIVQAGTFASIGLNSYSGWTLIKSNATFQPSRGNSGAGSMASSVITNNGTLLIQRQDGIPVLAGVTWGYSNNIVGAGRLVKDNNNQNAGAVILAGNNTYSNGTWIAGGGIILGDNVDAGKGSIIGPVYFTNTTSGNFNLRLLDFYRPDTYTFTNNIISVATDGTDPTLRGALEQDGSGTIILTGNNSYPGGTTVSNGTLVVGAGGTSGSIGSGAVVDSTALVFNRSDSVTVQGGVSGPGTLVQEGTGTLTLSNVNVNLTGATVVSNGTLVASSLGGNVTVNGGALAPGGLNSVGTLLMTNAGNLSIAGGNLQVTLNKSLAQSNSFILLTNITIVTNADTSLTTNGSAGTATYTAGTLNLANAGPALVAGDRFVLLSEPLTGGGAMPIALAGYTFNNQLAVDGSITVLTVPVSTPPKFKSITLSGTNIIITATNNTGGTSGYHLLGTNNITAPLSNWPVVSSGSFDTSGNLAITNGIGTNGQQFFILRTP